VSHSWRTDTEAQARVVPDSVPDRSRFCASERQRSRDRYWSLSGFEYERLIFRHWQARCRRRHRSSECGTKRAKIGSVTPATLRGERPFPLDGRCSFCGRSHEQVEKIVAGRGGVGICNECVGLCVDILEVESSRARDVGGWDAARQAGTRFHSMFEQIREKSDELLMIPDLPDSAASAIEALQLAAVIGAGSASFLEEGAERVTGRRQPRKEETQGDEPS
jgi:ClpX C4-type zinc finger